ncbi:MAG: flavodoxin family protein [Alphaproteobacteria bacterium]|nr:flavodoxin family protein [Alphaproteobacteria bacterium]
MTTIAIVYHSGYGHTEVIAKAVAEGVTRGGGTAKLLKIEKADQDFAPIFDAIKAADGVIMGAPTYMGGLSAPFKAFIDASSKPWFKQEWKDKLAGGFTNSGNLSGDKSISLIQLFSLAMQHSMIWVGPGVLRDPAFPVGDPAQVNRLGSFAGVMAQSDQAAPDVTPPEGDKEFGRVLGERVAMFAAKLK